MNKEQIQQTYQGELHYYWKAYYKDGTELCQFEEKEGKIIENNFSEIDRNPEKFKKFELLSLENKAVSFIVYLDTGDFNLNGTIIKNNIEIGNSQLHCIFWRRKVVTVLSTDGSESHKFAHYTIGWQTTINKANIKKEYKIYPDNSVKEILFKQNRAIFTRARIVKNK